MLCVDFLFWYIAHNWNYGILATPARTIVKTRLKLVYIFIVRLQDKHIHQSQSLIFLLTFQQFSVPKGIIDEIICTVHYIVIHYIVIHYIVIHNNNNSLHSNSLDSGPLHSDSFFHSDEQPELNLENDYPNKTGYY